MSMPPGWISYKNNKLTFSQYKIGSITGIDDSIATFIYNTSLDNSGMGQIERTGISPEYLANQMSDYDTANFVAENHFINESENTVTTIGSVYNLSLIHI